MHISFRGATTADMYDTIILILEEILSTLYYLLLQMTRQSTSNWVLDKILFLKTFIMSVNKNSKVSTLNVIMFWICC